MWLVPQITSGWWLSEARLLIALHLSRAFASCSYSIHQFATQTTTEVKPPLIFYSAVKHYTATIYILR